MTVTPGWRVDCDTSGGEQDVFGVLLAFVLTITCNTVLDDDRVTAGHWILVAVVEAVVSARLQNHLQKANPEASSGCADRGRIYHPGKVEGAGGSRVSRVLDNIQGDRSDRDL